VYGRSDKHTYFTIQNSAGSVPRIPDLSPPSDPTLRIREIEKVINEL